MTALDIAKYIVTGCSKANQPVTQIHLQNMLFVIQVEYLKRGQVAFSESIEARRFGPCVPGVYYAFAGFGSMEIQMEYDTAISAKDKEILDMIIAQHIDKKPWDYEATIRKPGSPWDLSLNQVIQNNRATGSYPIITIELMKQIYCQPSEVM